jgi:hypothetical protein
MKPNKKISVRIVYPMPGTGTNAISSRDGSVDSNFSGGEQRASHAMAS